MRLAGWLVVTGAVLAGGVVEAATLKLEAVDGTIEAVQDGRLTLRDARDKRKELALDPGARWVARRPLAADDLQQGDRVRVVYKRLPSGELQVTAIGKMASPALASPETSLYPEGWTGGSGSAIPTESSLSSAPQTVTGTVTSLRGDRATLKVTERQKAELVLDADTRFIDSRPLAKEDLREGDRVRAFLRPGKGGGQVIAIGAVP